MSTQTGTNTTMERARAVLQTPRAKRFGKWFAGGLLVFALFGFFVAPPVLKSVLLSQLGKELHREVAIADISINPFALSAKVSGFSVKADDGREVAGFDELYVNLSSASLFKLAAVVDAVRLQGARVAVARVGEGRYDISDLLDEWMKPKDEPDTGTPRFSVNNIQLVDARIVFDDRPRGKVHTISDINLGIPFVSSLPYQAEVEVEPNFSANIDGSQLALKGRSKPFTGTHESELDLDLDHFDLAGLQPYLPENLPLRLNAGIFDSELKAVFKEVSDQVFSLSVIGSAHVSGLDVNAADGSDLLGWKRLDVDLENADVMNRKFAVRRVAIDGIDASLKVGRQGQLNVLALAGKPAGHAAPENRAEKKPAAPENGKASAPAPALSWSLGEFVLSNGIVHYRDESNAVPVVGEIHDLKVLVGKLDSRMADPLEIREVAYGLDFGDALRVASMQFKDVRVDLAGQRVDVGEFSNHQTRLRMTRTREGRVDWLTPPQIKQERAAAPASGAEGAGGKAWVANIARVNIEDLAARFEDRSMAPAAVQEIEGFGLQAENLGNEPNKAGHVALQGKINKKGSLKVDGSLQAVPLQTALKIETQAIPLMPLEPYFGQRLNIALSRGLLSNKGEANVQIDKGGAVKATYKGSVTLGDFLAVDKINSADFLKWKSLYIGGIDFRLDPMTVNVGEIALSDFYSRLILSQAGRLNVQDIVKKPNEAAAPITENVPPAEVAQAATEPAARPADPATAAASPAAPKAPLPIRIAKITLQNGTINFSDFFVKPNYTVNITKLGGRVTGLSSAADTVADLELRGSYANSAPVLIAGKLNPLAAKSYLDIKTEITGIDLVGFSPYSGKYAGYAIEKGKLSMNLAYKLENNQLSADNKLFIDQFTFGEKVDSPDATKLPVNLAISLLKNNRGEIDINLPISGSIDDPQFSVGGLIVRVIVNLFVKAVTSPFALLGSMFGDGEELSNVEFAPGRASLDEAARKKLTTLSKALGERAALKLEITGRVDPEADREGIKRAAIERAMKTEKMKDGIQRSGEGDSLENIEIAPEEYQTYLSRAYKAAKFPKPRNVVGMQKDLPVEEMEKLMLANLPATDEDMRALAQRRAEAVQSWLVEQGKVPVERIFLLPAKTVPDDKGKGNRVDFSLH